MRRPEDAPWRRIGFAFVFVCITTWLSGLMHGQEPAIHSINRHILAEMRRQQIPGMSVAILRGNQVLLARGYGFSNVELRVPASDSTVYQSGSVGKQFTATAVLMLAEQGRLRLDDKIVKYLPEGAGVWDAISVRHLLTHTSGVSEYTDSTFDYRKDYSEDQLVRFAASRALDFAPGHRWAYSNTGYLLLGALIRRATGRFYGDVLQDLIFSPLGMQTARVISEADIVPHRAAGYRLIQAGIKNQEWVAPSLNTTADGSLYFSINDLTKWAVSLNNGRIPGAAALRTAWSPARLNDSGLYPYGFGWDLTPQRGHQRIGHTGSWQGFKTAIYRYPEFKLTVIALTNLAQSEPGPIAQGVAGVLEPALRPPHHLARPLRSPQPPLPIGSLLGLLASGQDTLPGTPALHRFLSSRARADLREQIASVSSWTALGCDDVAARAMSWLAAPIQRICYATGVGPKERVVVSVFYTGEWRAAHLDISLY